MNEEIAGLLKGVRLVVFDFDGVFTDNRVIVAEDGKESVVCDRSDGLGLNMLRERGIEMVIISTEVNPVVQMRAKKLKLPCISGCEDKLEALNAILKEKKISLGETAYIGNDINDLPCLWKV